LKALSNAVNAEKRHRHQLLENNAAVSRSEIFFRVAIAQACHPKVPLLSLQ
jgi:hypothetical protein